MSNLAEIIYDLSPEKKPFAVVDYGSANWCATTAMDAVSEIASFEAKAKKFHEMIDEWLAKVTADYYATIERMKGHAEPWVKEELKGKKERSLVLPSQVRMGFRKSTNLEVADEAAAVKWLEDHGKVDCVRVKKEVKKDETKALIKATGEIPDGCMPHSNDTFYIEPV